MVIPTLIYNIYPIKLLYYIILFIYRYLFYSIYFVPLNIYPLNCKKFNITFYSLNYNLLYYILFSNENIYFYILIDKYKDIVLRGKNDVINIHNYIKCLNVFEL